MVERAGGMAFAAGALVFPGGRIDEADRQLGGELGVDAAAVAAIRETIEETAVPVGISPVPDHASMCGLQDALVADRPFGELLNEHGLRLDAAALTPFARWVPKFHAVRRFDTLFFIARCPAGDVGDAGDRRRMLGCSLDHGGRGAGARSHAAKPGSFFRRGELSNGSPSMPVSTLSAPMRSRTRSSR